MAKRESRATRRARLLDEAAQVELPAVADVAVIGGGAAGLAAAIAAAEAGAHVVVLERDLACGRTILATGNGRCNFANVRLDPRRYNQPAFVGAVCGQRWLDDVLAFFKASGLRWSLEDDRLYPSSRQAASVRNVLLARAREAGVVLAPAREVARVACPDEGAGDAAAAEVEIASAGSADGPHHVLRARTVVLATGGGAAPLAGALGVRIEPTTPVLCPLTCADSPLAALDGRRVHAIAQLTKEGSFFPSWRERGEVLFRSYGLSGIVTFDLSRRAEAHDLVELDLTPDVTPSELRQLVDPFACGSFAHGCLDGVLDPVIAQLLERLARERWRISWPERTTSSTDSEALMALVKGLPLVVSGRRGEEAQVTRGGLATDQFDAATLACAAHPWLHACGEALDVDADCGGFNLAWAWKSGLVAGAAAAREARA